MTRSADREELRIALVMNGGVSLAIWMGGLTHEVNRVLRGEGVYGDLLDLLEIEPHVDVISGTSAGGINGALLSLAMVRGQSLELLRDLWVEKGAFNDLLRDPFEPLPSSLLKGDDYFLEKLKDAFSQLNSGGSIQAPKDAPIDLTLTATLLKGERAELADDFGRAITDVRHRAAIRFRRGPDVDTDPFVHPDIADRLALASRSTACFPVAFEPSFIPVGPKEPIPGRPDMREHVDFQGSRFVIDGGLLDNKPLGWAIDAIYKQRTMGDSRRVLMYVVPDPSEGGSEGPDEIASPPQVSGVLVASLFQIPRTEPVGSEITDVRTKNREAMERRESQIVLTTRLAKGTVEKDIRQLSEVLFPVYQARRTNPAISYIVSQIADGLAALAVADRSREAPSGSPPAPRIWLERQSHRAWLAEAFRQRILPWVPQTNPQAGGPGTLGAELQEDTWGWGIRAVEHAASQMLDLLRRTQRITPLGHEARGENRLPAFWDRAYDLVAGVHRVRRIDGGFWKNQAQSFAAVLEKLHAQPASSAGGAGQTPPELDTWVRDQLTSWRTSVHDRPAASPPGGGETIPAMMGRLAHEIARAILEMSELARTVAKAALQSPLPEDRAAAKELQTHLDYLVPSGTTAAREVILRLTMLEIAQYALGTATAYRDQYVELIQVSGNTPSPLGGPGQASEKLTGVQLGHFGAFYKRSWRANDWMFGELDGAANLVQVILSPDRLRRIAVQSWSTKGKSVSQAALDALRKLAVDHEPDSGARAVLDTFWDEPQIARELAYLDRPAMPAPDTLPACADAVARRIQLETIRNSLPRLAQAVSVDEESGIQPGSGARLKRAVEYARGAAGNRLSAEDALQIFRTHTIGEESIGEQMGSDLFSATTAKTLAVASSVGYGAGESLGPAKNVFRMARAIALAFYLMTRNMLHGSRTGAAVNGAAMAAGAAIVGLILFGVTGIPPWVVTMGWALLGAGILVGLFRWMGATLVAVVLGVLAWFLRGQIARVLPWLASEKWGPPIVIAAITCALLILGSVRRPRWLELYRAVWEGKATFKRK